MVTRGLMTKKCFAGAQYDGRQSRRDQLAAQSVGVAAGLCRRSTAERMMASKRAKGASLKAAVLQEKQKEAKEDAERMGREEAVRTLLGPRGGLPTLEADLIKLAALLQVPLEDKDTVEAIKKKVRPMIGALRGHATPSSMETPASSSAPASATSSLNPAMASRTPMITSATSSLNPAMASRTPMITSAAPALAVPMTSGPMPLHLDTSMTPSQPSTTEVEARLNATMASMMSNMEVMMQAQDTKFQAMWAQVFQHVAATNTSELDGTMEWEPVSPIPAEQPDLLSENLVMASPPPRDPRVDSLGVSRPIPVNEASARGQRNRSRPV